MEFLLEIIVPLLQLVGELLLQGFFGLLVEGTLHVLEMLELAKPDQKPPSVLAVTSSLFAGMLSGAVSFVMIRHSLISHVWLRIANLIITPCIAAWAMVALDRWRMRRNPTTLTAHRAVYGFLFAFAFVLTRLYITTR
jgi:hypothetical protein